jgi:hypothetical protein
MPDTLDDDQLLAALQAALSAWQDIPPEFIDTARNAYSWLNIDAELAQVAYDSAHDLDTVAGLRSEPASTRVLTFASEQLTIELEVSEDTLLGQVIPAGPGAIEFQPPTGAAVTVTADDLGCFRVSPVPAMPFRLNCRTAAGADLLTGWVSP